MFHFIETIAAGPARLWHTDAMREEDTKDKAESFDSKADDNSPAKAPQAKEVGGRGGLEPTRYGDWEKAGRCIDF